MPNLFCHSVWIIQIVDCLTKDVFWNGFLELKKVWKQLEKLPILKKFLPAFFVYSTALQTVILIATYFGEEEILWANTEQKTIGLIVLLLVNASKMRV